MKTYDYKGLLVRVSDDVQYIGLDPFGTIRGYIDNPLEIDERGSSNNANLDKSIILNWKKTIIETKFLKEYSPVVLYEIAPQGAAPYSKGDKYTIQSKINEEQCLNTEVHIVLTCYIPGYKIWTQTLEVKVSGLSLDNSLMAVVTDVIHELHSDR